MGAIIIMIIMIIIMIIIGGSLREQLWLSASDLDGHDVADVPTRLQPGLPPRPPSGDMQPGYRYTCNYTYEYTLHATIGMNIQTHHYQYRQINT